MRHFAVQRFCYTAAAIIGIGVAYLVFNWLGHHIGTPSSIVYFGNTVNEWEYALYGVLLLLMGLTVAALIGGILYALYNYFFPKVD